MNEPNSIVFIDTNIFLRVLLRDNEEMFQQSFAFLEAVKKGKYIAYTSSFVLSEVFFVLKSFYKFPKERCIQVVESILALPNLSLSNEYAIEDALTLAKTTSVKFTDCIIASHTLFKKQSAVIISYDKDFDQLGVKRRVNFEYKE